MLNNFFITLFISNHWSLPIINKDLTEQYNENTCYALDRLEISNPSEIVI
jgi:hypothetical protein